MSSMKICVLHSNADYLVGLRLPLLMALQARGLEVCALAPNMDSRHIRLLGAEGIVAEACPLAPTGLNPMTDISNSLRLSRILKRLSPDILLTNTIKPVIFGSIAGAIAGIRSRNALVSGLGYAFTDDGRRFNVKKQLIRLISAILYAVACRLNRRVIFQNQDDLEYFVSRRICPAGRAVMVPGSGIDLDKFEFRESTIGDPIFVMVSRLLAEKGVREFLSAARAVKSRHPTTKFLLVGGGAGNPSAVGTQEVQRAVEDGVLEWAGDVDDVRPWLGKATVFVLPSYREGLPRSTLEAMATGLAVITTDVPGCRETVVQGLTGLIVPARDSLVLADAMLQFVARPEMARSMGRHGRRLAENRFDVTQINAAMCSMLGLANEEGA